MFEWQHIPLYIHPIAFSVGFFSIYWYALFLLTGFFFSFSFLMWWSKKVNFSSEDLWDMATSVFLGALVGGRLGYALFYNLEYFLEKPLALFIPYDFTTNVWTGISGMSFHGGLIGVAGALFWWTRKRKQSFWKTADMVALAVPVTLFFGRLGNFFTGELYGRLTEQPWGMFFPGAFPPNVLRHPSELYEAFLEGILLLLILIFASRKVAFPGMLSSLFIIGYATLRFFVEYFRAPDEHIGFIFSYFTLGQLLSLYMFFSGAVLLLWLKRRDYAKIA